MAKTGTSSRIAPQIVGNAGLYYVSHHLSLLGWNTLPTSRNAKGVDLICYNNDCTRMIGVQVKALSKKTPVPLGKCLDNIIGDFWVIVNNLATAPTAFIMLPDEVRDLAHRGVKNGKVSYWLQPKAYDCDSFRNAWNRFKAMNDSVPEIMCAFFGPATRDDYAFCCRHQGVIKQYMHGLLTLRWSPRKTYLNIVENPACIPGWVSGLKDNPSHGPILSEFFVRLMAHYDRTLRFARNLTQEHFDALSSRKALQGS